MLRTISIILFGAAPATLLSFFAVLGFGVGVNLIATVDAFLGLVFVCWAAAGLYGAASLWFAAFDRISTTIAIGLMAGCVAIIPLILRISSRTENWPLEDIASASLMLSPLVCALILLANYASNLRRKAVSEDGR